MRLHLTPRRKRKLGRCGLRSGYMRLHSLGQWAIFGLRCGLRSGYMRLHFCRGSKVCHCRCGLRSGYMRLHSFRAFQLPTSVVVCGQAICDYTRIAARIRMLALWFAVRLYAITLSAWCRILPMALWFAVRLYAITLTLEIYRPTLLLWFAVRLYAITLFFAYQSSTLSCGLRSGYMRLH